MDVNSCSLISTNLLLLNNTNGGGDSSGFTPEYQAVLDFGTGESYQLPSGEQQIQQDAMIADLKAAGLWEDDIGAMWVFATDGDSDFATINWKDPNAFQCTQVNSPTFTPNVGFTGNGSSSYLSTNCVLGDVLLPQANSFLTNCNFSNGVEIGADGGGILLSFVFSQVRIACDPLSVGLGSGERTIFVNRLVDDVNTYDENVLIQNSTAVGSSFSLNEIFILAMNQGGSPSIFSPSTIKYLLVCQNLNDTKRTAIYNILTNYIAAL